MPIPEYGKTVASIYDAVLDAEHQKTALQNISQYAGSDGANFLVTDKKTGHPCSLARWGCTGANTDEYLAYYGKIDPFLAAHHAALPGSWVRASEVLTPRGLARDEWYNDYLLKGGVCDILGIKLYENASHVVYVGLLRATGSSDAFPRNPSGLAMLTDPLCGAAQIYLRMLQIGLHATIDHLVVDHLAAGVILADDDGRVLEMNRSAEAIIRLGDGLTVCNGRLRARRNFETIKLAQLVVAAANSAQPSAGGMLIAREESRAPYVVSVAPIGAMLSPFERPVAMVSITTPGEARISTRQLTELYGLSPAESRLALELSRGKRLSEIAGEFGVQITTLRTQLSAILRKLDAERQSDIVRLVAGTSVWASPAGSGNAVELELALEDSRGE